MHQTTDILQKAIAAAPDCPGLSFGQYQPFPDRSPGQPDGFLPATYDGQAKLFSVYVQPDLQQRLRAASAHQPASDGDYPTLLIVDRMGRKDAQTLAAQKVAFLDVSGNAHITLPGLYLLVMGNRISKPGRKPSPGLAFGKSGMKLIFAFLTDPNLDHGPDSLMNQRFRTIKQQTGVSLGSIGSVFDSLQQAGFLIEDDDLRLLVDRGRLFDKWVGNYTDRFRPKLRVRRFTAPTRDWWQDVQLIPPGQLWGEEVAGAKMTGFLVPGQVTIYSRNRLNDLILDAGLKTDDDGDVWVVDPFWDDWPHAARGDCTHPLLVYADLMASGLDRNRETAQRIYDDYLRQVIAAA